MMQNTVLNQTQIDQFALKALQLAFPEFEDRHNQENIHLIQQTRRSEDNGNQVWQVYNVIQESLFRGNLKLEGMKRALKPIRELDRDFKLNQELWSLALNAAKAA